MKELARVPDDDHGHRVRHAGGKGERGAAAERKADDRRLSRHRFRRLPRAGERDPERFAATLALENFVPVEQHGVVPLVGERLGEIVIEPIKARRGAGNHDRDRTGCFGR
jgi:hypothetical protein